jgi:hypothetical protein
MPIADRRAELREAELVEAPRRLHVRDAERHVVEDVG